MSKADPTLRKTFLLLRDLLRTFPRPWLLAVGLGSSIVLLFSLLAFGHLDRLLVDAAIGRDVSAVLKIVFLVLGVQIFRAIAQVVAMMSLGQYVEGGVAQLREMVLGHVGRLALPNLELVPSSDFISRLTNDVNRVRLFLNEQLLTLLPVLAFFSLVYLCWTNWKLTAVMVISISFLLWLSSSLSRPMSRLGRELQESLSAINRIVQETVTGMQVVRAFNLGAILEARYGRAVDEAVIRSRTVFGRRVLLEWASAFGSVFPYLILYAAGGYWVLKGEMTAGSLVAFGLLSNNLVDLRLVPSLLGEMRSAMASAERVLALLELELERTTGYVTSPGQSDLAVKVTDLTFTYPGHSEPALRELTVTVRNGERVAVVGPSGSGKSTLLKLLLGLYPEYSGEIEILGHSLKDWSLVHLRDHIAWLPQDPHLFPGTLRENIAYGRLGATDPEIMAAARDANAFAFINELPGGFDSHVGELGNKLSGGEKQRIALARAILRGAPLCFLDEPTSALDANSEALVQETLVRALAGRTVVTVAHRLSTVKEADRILVLADGAIVEEGRHEELLAKKGLYWRLYQDQLEAEKGKAV